MTDCKLFDRPAAPAMFLPSCFGTDLLKELEMQPTNTPAVLFAAALPMACWAATDFVGAAAAQGPTPGAAGGDVLQTLGQWSDGFGAAVTQLHALLVAGYTRAPTLVLILSAFLLVPLVALASLFLQSAARRRALREARRVVELRAQIAKLASEVPADAAAPLWPHQAWLSFEDGSAATMPLVAHMIRIGRQQDNDIQLPDASVHRYHAVIEHMPEEVFVITDLSGKEGNGLRINGERLARAQLADGDVIEVGRTRLRFESAPV